jgi:hypothetical protein
MENLMAKKPIKAAKKKSEVNPKSLRLKNQGCT